MEIFAVVVRRQRGRERRDIRTTCHLTDVHWVLQKYFYANREDKAAKPEPGVGGTDS